MELKAPIEALKFLKEKNLEGEINIYADSKYVINGVNSWILNWVKNGWKTANKKPVLNRELWMELHALNQYFKPTWYYVEGHSGHLENDRVDEIATGFADKVEIELKNDI
jgi:ribonuclease HI